MKRGDVRTVALLFVAILAGAEASSVARATQKPLELEGPPSTALLETKTTALAQTETEAQLEPFTMLLISGLVLLTLKVAWTVWQLRAKHSANLAALESFKSEVGRSMCDMRLSHYANARSLEMLSGVTGSLVTAFTAPSTPDLGPSRCRVSPSARDELGAVVGAASEAARAEGAGPALGKVIAALEAMRARVEALEAKSIGTFDSNDGGLVCSPEISKEQMRADVETMTDNAAKMVVDARKGLAVCMKDPLLGLTFTEMFNRLEKRLGAGPESPMFQGVLQSTNNLRAAVSDFPKSFSPPRPGSGAGPSDGTALANLAVSTVISTMAVAGIIDLKGEAPKGDVSINGFDMGFSLQHLVGAGVALLVTVPVKAYEQHLSRAFDRETAEARLAVCGDMATLLSSISAQARGASGLAKLIRSLMAHTKVGEVPFLSIEMAEEVHTAITRAYLYSTRAPLHGLPEGLQAGAAALADLLASPTLPQRLRTRILHSRRSHHVMDAILAEIETRSAANLEGMRAAVAAAECPQLGVLEQHRWEHFMASRSVEQSMREAHGGQQAAPAAGGDEDPPEDGAAPLLLADAPPAGPSPEVGAVVPRPALLRSDHFGRLSDALARAQTVEEASAAAQVPADATAPICSVPIMSVVMLGTAALTHSSERKSWMRSADPAFDAACESLQAAYSGYFSSDRGRVAAAMAASDLEEPCKRATAILKHTLKTAFAKAMDTKLSGLKSDVWAEPVEAALVESLATLAGDSEVNGPLEGLMRAVTMAGAGKPLPGAAGVPEGDVELRPKALWAVGQAIYTTLRLMHPAAPTEDGAEVPEAETAAAWVKGSLPELPKGQKGPACLGVDHYLDFLDSWMNSLTGPHAWFFASLTSVLNKDAVKRFTDASVLAVDPPEE